MTWTKLELLTIAMQLYNRSFCLFVGFFVPVVFLVLFLIIGKELLVSYAKKNICCFVFILTNDNVIHVINGPNGNGWLIVAGYFLASC